MRKQIEDLRRVMKDKNVSVYIVPTTDFHGSEYVNDYFKCREFLSGFTGSAGTLVVTEKEAKLWTDGRYFLQGAMQLEGSGIDLMKMGEPGVPSIEEYIEGALESGGCLGFDGRAIDGVTGRNYEKIAAGKNASLKYDEDLAGLVWADRPEIVPSEIFDLPEESAGESTASKLSRIRAHMKEKGADYYLTTKLDDIAWIFNRRGGDVECTPVFFSFAIITMEKALLYVYDQKLTVAEAEIRPYFDVFDDIKKLAPGRIILDENVVSVSLIKDLPDSVEIISEMSPATVMKAVKNKGEIKSTKHAHVKDGVAMVNFIYKVKHEACKTMLTELDAAKCVLDCRKAQEGLFDISFETISGYNENGAIIHYAPTPESNRTLEPHGFLLVDSGGQYLDGTTDITRTIALGPLTDEMKKVYTAVLKGHIALATSVFEHGMTGAELDAVTRKPIIAEGYNYNHGTGHGVGHVSCVHEGPNTFSPRGKNAVIVPDMITTDEPGVYLEGKFGVRIENELLCVKQDDKYAFEVITLCPFEREAVLVSELTEKEKNFYNAYSKRVYDTLAPLLSDEVREWLKKETMPL